MSQFIISLSLKLHSIQYRKWGQNNLVSWCMDAYKGNTYKNAEHCLEILIPCDKERVKKKFPSCLRNLSARRMACALTTTRQDKKLDYVMYSSRCTCNIRHVLVSGFIFNFFSFPLRSRLYVLLHVCVCVFVSVHFENVSLVSFQ